MRLKCDACLLASSLYDGKETDSKSGSMIERVDKDIGLCERYHQSA